MSIAQEHRDLGIWLCRRWVSVENEWLNTASGNEASLVENKQLVCTQPETLNPHWVYLLTTSQSQEGKYGQLTFPLWFPRFLYLKVRCVSSTQLKWGQDTHPPLLVLLTVHHDHLSLRERQLVWVISYTVIHGLHTLQPLLPHNDPVWKQEHVS